MNENENRTEEAIQKLEAKKGKAALKIVQNYKEQAQQAPSLPPIGVAPPQVAPPEEKPVSKPVDVQLKEFAEEFDRRITTLEGIAQTLSSKAKSGGETPSK